MKVLKDYFYNRCLPRLLEDGRRCDYGDRGIPRSGEDGENVNCYSIALYDEEIPYLMLGSMDAESGEIQAYRWAGSRDRGRFEEEVVVTLDHIREYTIKIRHYYGLGDVLYTGALDYIYGKVFMFPYMQINAARAWYAIRNFMFMRKGLTAKNRWKVLKLMLEEQTKRGAQSGMSDMEVLELVHSYSWIIHPNANEVMNTMRLHLDSFVDSGELAYDGRTFTVQGRAVATIEQREQVRRRSVRNFFLAVIPIFLTAVGLVVGVVTNDKVKEIIKGLFDQL